MSRFGNPHTRRLWRMAIGIAIATHGKLKEKEFKKRVSHIALDYGKQAQKGYLLFIEYLSTNR